SSLPLDHYWFCCDFVEPGQRRLRSGSDIHHSVCDSNLRGDRRRRLRTGGTDNLVRSLPDRNTRSRHGDFLCGDSCWERPRVCNRRAHRCSLGLALGILSRHTAGFVAWPVVFLATRSASRCGSRGAEIATSQPARLRETLPDAFVSHQLRRSNVDDICNRWSGFLGISISPLSESKSG